MGQTKNIKFDRCCFSAMQEELRC